LRINFRGLQNGTIEESEIVFSEGNVLGVHMLTFIQSSLIFTIWIFFCNTFVSAQTMATKVESESDSVPTPRGFIIHSEQRFQESLQRYRDKDPATLEIITALRNIVDAEVMPRAIPSVMDKPLTPVSGDKHDYMSMSPYWWPNPDTADGYPFIRRDGERNPLRDKLDNNNMSEMATSVWLLSVLYTFTHEEAYAEKAAQFLNTWFLDPSTKMNPNMLYSQTVPGETTLRRSGILDSQRLIRIVDAFPLLKGSAHWSPAQDAGIQHWFKDFSDWLYTSEQGKGEIEAENNHGSYCEAQVAIFAAFGGNTDLAKDILMHRSKARIQAQFTADGKQPEELARTRPFHYCLFNLDAFLLVAALGDSIGVDLWHFQGTEGQGIQSGIQFLSNYAAEPSKWEFGSPPKTEDLETLAYVLNVGIKQYNIGQWRELVALVPQPQKDLRGIRLLLEMEIF
jgi:hypothetical protein